MDIKPLRDLIDQSFEGICYRTIAPGSHMRRQPPKLITGAKPSEFDDWFFSDNWVPEVGLYNLANIHLLGDCVLFRSNAILSIPENGIHEESIRNVITAGFGRGQQVLRIDEEVVLLCGPAYQMYGHWLLDFLPRLFCLVASGYELTKLRYLLPIDLSAVARHWLAALGIISGQIIFYDKIAQQCAVSRAMIPTNLRGSSLANPLLADAFGHFKTLIQPIKPASCHRKIFVSRMRWANMTRRCRNAYEVQAFFAGRGFEIVYPEMLSIPDQIELFSQTSVIAGEYGTGLHSAVFAPPSAKVIALRANHAHPAFLQSGLCDVLGQDCSYVFGRTALENGNQVFTIDLADVAACLDHELI